ncbi:hypothetical protein LINPERPRIM_LOCUS14187 [Linum perenne]
MGNYRRLLLLQLHFNPPSPLVPSVAVQFPDEFNRAGISPYVGDLVRRKRASGANLSWRLRYDFRDEQLFTDDTDDRYDGFRFGGASKKRVWWQDDDEEEDDSWEFGGSRNEFPIFKRYVCLYQVISALGWMVPAIAVSMLVGTDQNPFVMALAVPLVQTVVSIVVDKLWGRPAYDRPRTTKSWTKTSRRTRRPFSGAGSRTKEQEVESRSGNGYQSWVASNDGSRNSNSKDPGFGGWDELDGEGSESQRVRNRSRKGDGSRKQGNRVRMSRRRRVGDRPLWIRLLVSVFPFMSSWSSFLL